MIATLRSERLLIAPLIADDLGFYVSLYTDPATMTWIGTPMSPAAAARSLAVAVRCNAQVPLRRLTWTLTDTQRGMQVGLLALIRDAADLAADAAEVGAIIPPPRRSARSRRTPSLNSASADWSPATARRIFWPSG